mmetsp:Transcript_4955/g.18416  ORF Transcript_4955/g.18416 Transcript_4955/m.18416 type:complete len:370 (-) Transcript_4955:1167-2276(-)
MPSSNTSNGENTLGSVKAPPTAPDGNEFPETFVVASDASALASVHRSAFHTSVPGGNTPVDRPHQGKRVSEKAPEPMTVTKGATKAVPPVTDVAPAGSSTNGAFNTAAEVSVNSTQATEASKSGIDNFDQTAGVAFFDLDHTIIDTNSNKHWITTEIKNGRVTFKLIVTAVYWFAKYAMGNGEGAEVAGAEAAMAYAGKSSADLKKEVVAVFDAHLKHRMRPGCGPSMATHRQRNERIVICTSSWQYAAQYAAELFGCETDSDNVLSSVMEEENGKLTGAIAEIAYGDGKYLVTKKWCDKNGIDLNDCYFYSDSMSDVKLLEMVGHPVVVNPDPRLRKRAEERGWPIEDWGAAPEKQANLSKKKGMRFF